MGNFSSGQGIACPSRRRVPPGPSFLSTAGMTLVLALLLLAAPLSAHAWGPLGHRLVAELAERQLDPAIVPELHRLLDESGASSLAEVANWADDVREGSDDGELARRFVPQHRALVDTQHATLGFDDDARRRSSASRCRRAHVPRS